MIEQDEQEHWDRVYKEKAPTAVSWFQPTPEPSVLALTRVDALPPHPSLMLAAAHPT